MVGLDHQLAGPDVGIRHHLGIVVDGAARHPARLQKLQPVRPGTGRQHRLDAGREGLPVADAVGIVPVLGVVGPLRMPQGLAQAPERAIVGGPDGQVAVGAADGLVRRVHAVRGPEPLGDAAPREVLRRLPHREGDPGVDERRVDELPEPRARPREQRRQDARDGEEGGAEVGHRYPRLDRWPPRLAGDRHEARDALRHEVEAPLAGGRAGLAVARDGRVDETRMAPGELRVVQAELLEHPRPVVLHQHVGHRGEAPHRVAAGRLLQVDDDAALAAVDGVEAGAVAADGARHAPGRVAGGRLDLDHVGAHVAQ